MVTDFYIPNIIKALGTMEIDGNSKIFFDAENSYVFKFIKSLKEENKNYFFEALCAIMSSENAINKIEEVYNIAGSEVFMEVRPLILEIMKFPNCSFEMEDEGDLRSKTLYLLTILEKIPERAFVFEDQLFEPVIQLIEDD